MEEETPPLTLLNVFGDLPLVTPPREGMAHAFKSSPLLPNLHHHTPPCGGHTSSRQ